MMKLIIQIIRERINYSQNEAKILAIRIESYFTAYKILNSGCIKGTYYLFNTYL